MATPKGEKLMPFLNLIPAILKTITLIFHPEATAVEISSPDTDLLTIGSKAPAITASNWLRGKPIDEIKPSRIYVVEFWTSW